MKFPATRMRRARAKAFSRELVSEQAFVPTSDLIWPLFVHDHQREDAVPSMPGVFRYSLEGALHELRGLVEKGLNSVAVFPVIDNHHKDANGSYALDENNIMVRAVKAISDTFPDLGVIADVALDPYTSHGHDGVLDANGLVDNDKTLELLRDQALLLARAGADVIAPSDMQDGRIGFIREALEAQQMSHVVLLSYSAKFASAFYGPFRDAVGSSGQLQGASKKTYQMDVANGKEALIEARLDLDEGADWLMVKPGMINLDVIQSISQTLLCPTFAYQVSGEYSMIMALAQQMNMAPEVLFHESFIAFKRAGARGILSYFTPRMLELHAAK